MPRPQLQPAAWPALQAAGPHIAARTMMVRSNGISFTCRAVASMSHLAAWRLLGTFMPDLGLTNLVAALRPSAAASRAAACPLILA